VLDGRSTRGVDLRARTIAAASFAILLVGHAEAEQVSKEIGKPPVVAEVLAVHKRLVAAARASDVAVFDELLSKDLVVSDPSNTIRYRDDLMALFGSGVVAYRSLDSKIDYADELDDLVVIMGTETSVLESVPEGSPWGPGATLHRRFTNIYRNEDGQWRLVLKQSTVFSVDRP
jgi:ketosteroid isomerase-like protein